MKITVPSELFQYSIDKKNIYYFSSTQINSPIPHYFICLQKTPDNLLIFSCCTSQYLSVQKYIEVRNLPKQTIVHIPPNNNPFDLNTYVNCNQCYTYTVDKFTEMYQENEIDYSGELNEVLFSEIIKGIKLSPLIDEDIKDLFE